MDKDVMDKDVMDEDVMDKDVASWTWHHGRVELS